MITNGPCAESFDEARDLAHRPDTWMTPTDDHRGRLAREDYGAWQQEQEAGWEETLHFEHFYGSELTAIAVDEAEMAGLENPREDNWETYYYDFYSPLKEAFWEEWHDVHDTHTFWQENIAKKSA